MSKTNIQLKYEFEIHKYTDIIYMHIYIYSNIFIFISLVSVSLCVPPDFSPKSWPKKTFRLQLKKPVAPPTPELPNRPHFLGFTEVIPKETSDPETNPSIFAHENKPKLPLLGGERIGFQASHSSHFWVREMGCLRETIRSLYEEILETYLLQTEKLADAKKS